MDDLFDAFDMPVETRLRLRMMESKRRQGHIVLRGSALVGLLVTVLAVTVAQLPVVHILAPLL
jgi:hypothetical protein